MSLKVRRNKAAIPHDIATTPAMTECPLTRCMDLLSGAWAAHVIWHLSHMPRRFGELRRDIPAISARVLSQRLRELEAKKVVSRAVIPTTPPSVEYALTDLGRRLVPAVAAIAGVGEELGQDPAKPPARRGNTVRRV
jgi:DNA-binding HxlR family transcriptional regulator